MNDPRRSGGGDWLVISVAAPPRGEELLLAAALRRVGARSIERLGDRVEAYFAEVSAAEAQVRAVAVAVRASTSLREVSPTWYWLPQADWTARWSATVRSIRATERIVVAPLGSETVHEAEIEIRLAPGAAFGTDHATTRACLRALDALVAGGDRLADVGTGSGILAIAAARLGAASVLAFEADPYACATARENVALNGVTEQVVVRELEVGPDALAAAAPFDGIVANLGGGAELPLLAGFADALASGGWIVVSGLSGGEREALRRAAAGAGLRAASQAVEDGWWTVTLRPR